MRGPMPTRRGRPGRSRPTRRPGVRAVSGGCAPGPPVPASPPCGGRRSVLRRSRAPGRPRPGVRGSLGLSAWGPRPPRRGGQPPGGRRCGVGGPGPRRPRLAGASVPGPVGRGGRSPPSRSASWRGGPSGLRPSASPCPSRPGAPQAAPYRAARLRHGRPPGLPPPGAGAAAASGRPGQSQRPGEGGLVLVLPGCCCGPGGPCCPAAWPLGTEARRPGLRSRVQTSGRQRPPLTSARPPGSG